MQKRFDAILSGLLRSLEGSTHEGDASQVKILLAVSGGIDSVCMAELFLNSSLHIPFAVAHCNFHLRGQESDSDAELVGSWASRNSVPFYKADFDTSLYAGRHKLSIEMAARDLRYEWFARLCDDNGFAAVAVAHNANDNAETMVLNLLRGTGTKGLCGMREISSLPVKAVPGCARLIRPLLSFTRAEIQDYVENHNIDYHSDSTNAQTQYKRNKVRHLIFPLFEQLNPSFLHTLNQETSYFSEVDAIAEQYFKDNVGKTILNSDSPDGTSVKIDIHSLMDIPHWEYILFRILDEYGFNSDETASVADLLKNGKTVSGRIFASKAYEILSSSTVLTVRPRSRSGLSIVEGETSIVVEGEGTYQFNGTTFSVQVLPWKQGESPKQPDGVLCFDSDKLPFPFLARGWRKGDRMQPLGLKGSRKLSDIFVSMKYDLRDKSLAVVLIKPGVVNVAALLGYRIDDSLKISSSTRRVLFVRTLS